MNIMAVGIDLAKNVFAVHGVNDSGCLRREIGAHLKDLPGYANLCVGDLLAHVDELDKKIDEYDRAIAKAAREDEREVRLDDDSTRRPETNL